MVQFTEVVRRKPTTESFREIKQEVEEALSPKSNFDLNANSSGKTLVTKGDFGYIEPCYNYQGNYHNYINLILFSLIPLQTINFSLEVKERAVLVNDLGGSSLSINGSSKKTLILDLDETLIHADFAGLFKDHDHIIKFQFNNEAVEVPIFLRPGIFEFLNIVSLYFEVGVFTASLKEYADSVLNFIDPNNSIFKFRLYRDSCINVNNGKIFIKDLNILKNRKLENIVIVDNSLYSFANQLANGVLITSYYNDKNDKELINIATYLFQYILNSSDVRFVNENFFRFSAMLDETLMNYNQSNIGSTN